MLSGMGLGLVPNVSYKKRDLHATPERLLDLLVLGIRNYSILVLRIGFKITGSTILRHSIQL